MSATWRDRRDLFLLPYAASALSANASARALSHALARSNAFREEADNARVGAQAAQWPLGDEAQFHSQFRLQLALGYRDNWRLMRDGNCAAPFATDVLLPLKKVEAPLLIVSLHWGSAIFALREIARKFGPTHFVSAPFTKEEFKSFPLRFRYATRMALTIETACGAKQIFTGGGAADSISQALREKRNVCALIDVPPHQVGATSACLVQGRAFHLPNGLARIAHETRAHVVTLLSAPDARGGAHYVAIESLGSMPSAEALMPHCAALLERALAKNPAAWTMWAHLPDFLSADNR
jgi:hypothetical protein